MERGDGANPDEGKGVLKEHRTAGEEVTVAVTPNARAKISKFDRSNQR